MNGQGDKWVGLIIGWTSELMDGWKDRWIN